MEQALKPCRYICLECAYIYDPAKGDPKNGYPPGTPFEALPGDWICPECKVAKSKHIFKKLDE